MVHFRFDRRRCQAGNTLTERWTDHLCLKRPSRGSRGGGVQSRRDLTGREGSGNIGQPPLGTAYLSPTPGVFLRSDHIGETDLLLARGKPEVRAGFLVDPHTLVEIFRIEPGHKLHEQVSQICAATGAQISLDYGATSLDTIRQMVGMGLGLSLLPALYVRSEVQPNRLVTARPLAGPQPFRTVGMVWRARAARAAEYAELAQILRGILRKTAPEVTVVD